MSTAPRPIAPYAPRPIRPLGIWKLGAFRLKAYGIASRQASPDPRLVGSARTIAAERLMESTMLMDHHGVGFVGVHQSHADNFVFVNWWANDFELHQHAYVGSGFEARDLAYVTPTGYAGSVWDQAIIAHERSAWIRHVLAAQKRPDFASYLGDRLDAVV
jgi:hypothetical protein